MKRSIEGVAVAAIDKLNPIIEISPSLSENECGQEHSPCGQATPIMCITVTDTESEDEEINFDVQNSETYNANVPGTNTDEVNRESFRKQMNTNFTIKCASKCKELFDSREAMSYHVTFYHRRGVKKTFECHLCKRAFIHKRDFQGHINAIHSRQRQYTCPFQMCSSIFFRDTTLRAHIRSKHSRTQMSSSKANAIRRHRGTIPQFKCPRCFEYFESKNAWMYHVMGYHAIGKKKISECYLCRRICCSRQRLRDHMNALHSRQANFKCPFVMCSAIRYTNAALRQHIHWRHSKKVVFTKKKKQLANVKELSPGVSPFPECSQQSASANEQTKAIRIKRILECYFCKQRIIDRAGLQNHMNAKHFRVESFICPFEMCTNDFCRKLWLTAHINHIHKSVKCLWRQCSNTFENQDAMFYHLETFHVKGTSKSFECHLCKMTVSRLRSLRGHMISKHTAQQMHASDVYEGLLE